MPSKAPAAVWFSLNAFALCALASLLSSEVGAHPWSVSTSWFTAWVSVISEAKWSHLLPVVTCWQDQVCVLCDVTSSLGSCFPDGEFWSFHWSCVQSSTTSCSRIVQLNWTKHKTWHQVESVPVFHCTSTMTVEGYSSFFYFYKCHTLKAEKGITDKSH